MKIRVKKGSEWRYQGKGKMLYHSALARFGFKKKVVFLRKGELECPYSRGCHSGFYVDARYWCRLDDPDDNDVILWCCWGHGFFPQDLVFPC